MAGTVMHELVSFAVAEFRVLRRSVGMWVFAGLSCVSGAGLFALAAGLHGAHSAHFPVFGFIAPPFFLSQFGVHLLFVALLGTTFLAIDTSARAAREGVADVFGARPFSNVAMLGGRVLALAAAGWVSVFLVLGLLQGGSAVARSLGWWPGDSPAPASVATFLLIDLPPALLLWCSVLTATTVLVRSRLLSALLALLLVVALWETLGVPGYLVRAVIPVMAYERLVSDIVPRWVDGYTMSQRGALLLLAGGLTVIAAALHTRPDGRARSARIWCGTGLLAAGVACIGLLVWIAMAPERDRDRWRTAHHDAALDRGSEVDLVRVAGRVEIDPGVRLDIDVEIGVRSGQRARSLVLSLNPDMRIDALEVDGAPAGFVHEDGVLVIEPAQPIVRGATTIVSVRAAGVPDPSFAYLDSATDGRRVASTNRLRLAGSEASIFEPSYVALLPGVRWLPTAGVTVARGTVPSRDFFDVDLLVAVPKGWWVAGPGRARDATGPQATAFKFLPDAPVDEVAVFAAEFDRRTLDVAGTELALLVHAGHSRNVRLFEDTADMVKVYWEETLGEAERLGAPYPYDGLTLVEVPAPLRGYRGGADLRSAFDIPGIVPIRETTFPTARFESLLDRLARNFPTNPEFAAHAKAGHLITYAREAGLVRGFARNLFGTTTGATGEGAALLQQIGLDLADGLLPQPRAARVDSAHTMDRDASPGAVVELLAALLDGPQAAAQAYSRRHRSEADRPAVWARVAKPPAADDADDAEDAELALGVLALRASSASRAILDRDRRAGAALIGLLRRRHSGATFDASDFASASVEAGLDLAPAEWQMGATLPGFVASNADVARLADGPDGSARYQARLHVRNTESVAGRVFVSTDKYGFEAAKPVRVGGKTSVEIDWVGSEPPQTLWLHSYLSLNRHPFPITLTQVGVAERANFDESFGEPFGVRPSAWRGGQDDGVVVDDLDGGFSVETASPVRRWLRPAARRKLDDVDQGLPLFARFGMPMAANNWYREAVPSAWGRHRRTVALALAGDGEQKAEFTAELPNPGHWSLAYHIPPVSPPNFPDNAPLLKHIYWLGDYDMTLRVGGVEMPVEFDGGAAQPGWNTLGTFNIDSRHVDVVVTNRTEGEIVVADAVRWREMPYPTSPDNKQQ